MEELRRDMWFRSGAPAFVVQLSRVLGTAPLVFDEDRLRVSGPLMLYGQFLAVTTNGLAICFIFFIEGRSKTSRMIIILQSSMIHLTHFIAALLASSRMKIWIDIVKRVQTVQTKLGDNNSDEKRKEIRSVVLRIFVNILCGIVGCLCQTQCLQKINYFIRYFFRYFFSFVLLTMELQIIITYQYMCSVFRSYNKCLQQLLQDIDAKVDTEVNRFQDRFGNSGENVTSPAGPMFRRSLNNIIDTHALPPAATSTGTTKSVSETLRELNTLYREMCDIVDLMNERHIGLTTLMTVTCIITYIILTIYNGLNILLMKPIPVTLLVIEIFWLMHHLLCIHLILDPGHQIIHETIQIRLTTRKLMGKAMDYPDDEFADELEKFFTKLMLTQPTFSPLGVGDLSRQLLITIINVGVTYSMIAVQFQSDEKQSFKINNTAV